MTGSSPNLEIQMADTPIAGSIPVNPNPGGGPSVVSARKPFYASFNPAVDGQNMTKTQVAVAYANGIDLNTVQVGHLMSRQEQVQLGLSDTEVLNQAFAAAGGTGGDEVMGSRFGAGYVGGADMSDDCV